jgi:hypothetical protein
VQLLRDTAVRRLFARDTVVVCWFIKCLRAATEQGEKAK